MSRWLLLLRAIKKGKQEKGKQDAAAHRQRSSDCPLSPPYTAPTVRLRLAVKNTKYKIIWMSQKYLMKTWRDKFKYWHHWPPHHQSGNKTGSWRQVSPISSSELYDIKKGTKVKNKNKKNENKVWKISVKEPYYRLLSWVLASPARLPSRMVGGSGTLAPSRWNASRPLKQ